MEQFRPANEGEEYKTTIERETALVQQTAAGYSWRLDKGVRKIFFVQYDTHGEIVIKASNVRDLRGTDDYELNKASGLHVVHVRVANHDKQRIYDEKGKLIHDGINPDKFKKRDDTLQKKFPEAYDVEELNVEMAKALEVEDYMKAGIIRDELNSRKKQKNE